MNLVLTFQIVPFIATLFIGGECQGKKPARSKAEAIFSTSGLISDIGDPASCGRCPLRNSRIVGGEKAPFGYFPWNVAFAIWIYEKVTIFCGGALITNRCVISAAHCFYWLNDITLVTMILGDHDMSTTNDTKHEERKITEVMIHSKYDNITHENDIAIVKMNNIVSYGSTIKPICLPLKGSNFEGYTASIAGWGSTSSGGQTSNVLLWASINIWNFQTCDEAYTELNFSTNCYCASGKGKDSCQGDSGGPLIILQNGLYVLAGVTSFGIGCANPVYPGVYTRIDKFLDWIEICLKAVETDV